MPWALRAQPSAAWPTKPIDIVVPSAAGGAADFVGRAFGQFLTASLPGARVVVDDKPGAGGVLGTQFVKAAPADGYTFLISTNSTHAANVSLYRNLRYDPIKDFALIGSFGTFASVLVGRADAPYRTTAEFIEYARAHPGKLNYGYYSSSSRVPAELFRSMGKLDFVGASYKAITQVLTDLIAGQLDFVFIDTLSAAPALQNTRLRALAVTGPRPLPNLPGVPPVAASLPGYEVLGWFGLTAPAGTPAAVVEQMSRMVAGAVDNPAFRQSMEERGLTPRAVVGAEFERFVRQDITRWADWIRLAGIEAQ